VGLKFAFIGARLYGKNGSRKISAYCRFYCGAAITSMTALRNYFRFGRALANRRQFLRPFALLPIWMRAGNWAGQVDRTLEGQFRLADLGSLKSPLTRNDQFYVRNHFAAPQLTAAGWRLQVAGQVKAAMEISLAELQGLPSRTITATLECAGNGVGRGGVSTASWTGVPLAGLLRKAGLLAGVKHIRLVGADRGREASSQVMLPFARSIPLEKALHTDTLLAFRMNGEKLPDMHGYPVRAIVPGWYAMDSVKWLVQIEALDREDTSFYMTRRYVASRLEAVGTDQSPLTAMRVKSLILEPRDGDIVSLAATMIRGQAWAGQCPVAKVEVSTNRGGDWSPASLNSNPKPYTWVQWSFSWGPKATGSYELMARATDAEGNAQPAARDPVRLDGYELNVYQSVRCEAQ
jgi:DMSO/TMAO reductase YedYZ molybdopterin-dependent catalytic subunit